MSDTFTVNLSRSQRVQLSMLFLSKDLVIKGIPEQKIFNRARLSQGLTPIVDIFAANKPVSAVLGNDKNAHAFVIDRATVDFMLEKIAVLPMPGAHVALLGNYFEVLETIKLVGKTPELPKAPPLTEAEAWEDTAAAA